MPISGLIDITHQLPEANEKNRPGDRPMSAIREIVVHYDAMDAPEHYDPVQRYIGEANYHINKNWGTDPKHPIYGFGLMYAIKISRDGRKWLCNRFGRVLWHARIANYDGLAICVDLGPNQEPNQAQLKALHEVLMDACYKCPEFPAGRADVKGHCEVKTNPTACPGKLLPWVKKFRTGKW